LGGRRSHHHGLCVFVLSYLPLLFPSLILLFPTDPEAHKRGRYLAYWLGFRNAGQILGGIISLALNAKRSTAGSIGRSNYYIFIALRKLHFYLIPPQTLTILPSVEAFAPFVGIFLSSALFSPSTYLRRY
jgi:hypothetical protein